MQFLNTKTSVREMGSRTPSMTKLYVLYFEMMIIQPVYETLLSNAALSQKGEHSHYQLL
jgi:hypothetical protein